MDQFQIIKKNDPIGSFDIKLPNSIKTLDDLKDYSLSISYIDYSDYKPDLEDFEITEIKISNSKVNIDYKEKDNQIFATLNNATIDISFEDKDLQDRFLDKEWSEEWIEPTLFFKSKKNHFSVKYQDNSLFTLKII
jgi:hypothetical protein